MATFHPESPDVGSESLARLRFVADFRKQLHAMTGGNRAAFEAAGLGKALPDASVETRREALKAAMEAQPFFQGWSSMLRSSQDLMWNLVGQAVDADQDRLALRVKAMSNSAKGRVRLDPEMAGPAYITDADIHRMPGGYMLDDDAEDIRSGALYDLGGAIYQLGVGNKAGGLLNDSRGHTILAHLKARFPDFRPTRILDMGCGVGHNTVPLALAFPDAETVGIDVGAGLLRYAHLRAEGLGAVIEFAQANAEETKFESGSFDLVVSQIVLHETSHEATARIIRESRRLLKSGGVAIHLEVPFRADNTDEFGQFMSLWEEYYNAEPNISGVLDDDLVGLAEDAGLVDVALGFQGIPRPGVESQFSPEKASGPMSQWLVVSGRAP